MNRRSIARQVLLAASSFPWPSKPITDIEDLVKLSIRMVSSQSSQVSAVLVPRFCTWSSSNASTSGLTSGSISPCFSIDEASSSHAVLTLSCTNQPCTNDFMVPVVPDGAIYTKSQVFLRYFNPICAVFFLLGAWVLYTKLRYLRNGYTGLRRGKGSLPGGSG